MTSLSLGLFGDEAVGKSALVLRVTKTECLGDLSLTLNQQTCHEFHHPHEPTIEDSYRMSFGDPPRHIDILDTSGADVYSNLREGCIRQCQGFILVYDITSRSSFDFVQSLFSTILTIKHNEENKKPTLILVGNKSDQITKKRVDCKEGRDFAQRHGCQFFETSAKTAENVEEVFLEALRLMEHSEASLCGVGAHNVPSQDQGIHKNRLRTCMNTVAKLIAQHTKQTWRAKNSPHRGGSR